MADFKKALQPTLEKEGFYGNDPDDTGGETYQGIARKMNPNWAGWALVDLLRSHPNFPKVLTDHKELLTFRNAFYRVEFWSKIKGDNIINQEVANDLFDKAVNMGVKQAVILCQRTLGQEETGTMDTNTLNLLNEMNPYA